MPDVFKLKLSKDIPARTKTVKFLWCKQDFMLMSDEYRKRRYDMKSPMDSCYWCNHKFANGEMMALAAPTKGANKILCQSCVDKGNHSPS